MQATGPHHQHLDCWLWLQNKTTKEGSVQYFLPSYFSLPHSLCDLQIQSILLSFHSHVTPSATLLSSEGRSLDFAPQLPVKTIILDHDNVINWINSYYTKSDEEDVRVALIDHVNALDEDSR